MAKVEVVIKESEQKAKPVSLLQLARKATLAGIGAAVMGGEQMAALVDKLAERGDRAEREGRTMVREMMERGRRQIGRAQVVRRSEPGDSRPAAALEKQIRAHLDRANVPTMSDIQALSAQIAALSEKLDELKGTEKPGGTPA